MYAGGNDWENGITGVAVSIPSNEQLKRVWFTVKHKHDPDAESTKYADEIKEWGHKAWRKWKQVATEKHRTKDGITPSWFDSFKQALHDPAMKPFVKEHGVEQTKWKDVQEQARRIVNSLLEYDETEDVRSEVDRLLPTTIYRLGGNSMLHAPGVVAMAQRRWRERSKAAKKNAMDIIHAWPGLPDEVYLRILNGDCHIDTEGDTAVITVKNY